MTAAPSCSERCAFVALYLNTRKGIMDVIEPGSHNMVLQQIADVFAQEDHGFVLLIRLAVGSEIGSVESSHNVLSVSISPMEEEISRHRVANQG